MIAADAAAEAAAVTPADALGASITGTPPGTCHSSAGITRAAMPTTECRNGVLIE